MKKLLVLAILLAQNPVADAYVIASRAVFKRFAERQAFDRVTSGALIGRAQIGEPGKERDVPARFTLTLPGSCMAELELPEGTVAATFEKGKANAEKAPPALAALVLLACPLTVMKGVPASDGEAALVRMAGLLNVDPATVSLARLGRRTAYVVGARPRELDRPQVWFDKETSRPVRVIARHGGQLWDVRLIEEASPATGHRAPRMMEVWQKGDRLLSLQLMTAGGDTDAAAGANVEPADDDAE